MKPGNNVDEWGGSEWVEMTPQEVKREAELGELVKKVSSFFYESEGFVEIFEEFITKNAHKIDVTNDEMKLEYTDLYEEYQKLFEREIEAFIEAQGHTAMDFYERVREAQERDPWSHEAVFGQIMTATADFDIFMNMMREAAETERRKEDEKKENKSSSRRK